MTGPRLVVLPSLIENAPYTMHECLIAGVPFVATNVGGAEELIVAEVSGYTYLSQNQDLASNNY